MLVGWNFKHVRFKIVMNIQQLGPLLSSVQPLYWTQHWKYLISSFIFLILSDPGSVPHDNVTKVSQPNFPFSELSPIFRLMISSVSRSDIKQSRSQQHTGCLISDGRPKKSTFYGTYKLCKAEFELKPTLLPSYRSNRTEFIWFISYLSAKTTLTGL